MRRIAATAEIFIAFVLFLVVGVAWWLLGPSFAIGLKIVVFPSIVLVLGGALLLFDAFKELKGVYGP